jgi:hypothetical protein
VGGENRHTRGCKGMKAMDRATFFVDTNGDDLHRIAPFFGLEQLRNKGVFKERACSYHSRN